MTRLHLEILKKPTEARPEDLQASLKFAFGEGANASRNYLEAFIELLKTPLDDSVHIFILEGLALWHPTLAKHKNVQKSIIEQVSTIAFSSMSPLVRLKATMALVSMLSVFTEMSSVALKLCYRAFHQSCQRSITSHTLPMLSMSTNVLLEVLKTNSEEGRAFVLKLMRQLADNLYKSLKDPKLAISVLSWKWVAPLRLCASYCATNSSLHLPFIGLVKCAFGVRLALPTLPFHFHLLHSLVGYENHIPEAFGHLLSILSTLEATRSRAETAKPKHFALATLITSSDSESSMRSFHDVCIDESFYLLMKLLPTKSIILAEVCDNLVIALSSFHKNPRIRNHAKLFNESLRKASEAFKKSRLEFTPIRCDDFIPNGDEILKDLVEQQEKLRCLKATIATTEKAAPPKQAVKENKKRPQKEPKRALPKKRQQEFFDDQIEEMHLSSSDSE